ncbi:MAG: hypothetical protein ACTTKD_08995 [Peptoanaerobacter stomatis]|uniref:hypothetical protein n=1 Tax=Peptoanaerobacter stomatis TaxID=796937 RepID=UPI003F9FE5CB
MIDILVQSVHLIDYENDIIQKRDIPQEFSNYIKELIFFINSNESIRKYKTRSINNEVISCILNIKNEKDDDTIVSQKINLIANRLLLKEKIAQEAVSKMNVNVLKGSLIQSLLFDDEKNEYLYLLAKVEHSSYVDDTDLSFKTGFSKDKKKIWKTCIFNIPEHNTQEYHAKVYSNTIVKYWYDAFLELNEMNSDETNTERAFKFIDKKLNSIKKISPQDHKNLRYATITYFRTTKHFDFKDLIDIYEKYVPENLKDDEKLQFIDKVSSLENKQFDSQFTPVPKSIQARIRTTYEVYKGIQININEAIDTSEIISSVRGEDGYNYIQIKTDNDVTFNTFLNTH